MDTEKFDHYLETTRTIVQKSKEDRSLLRNLFQNIDDWKHQSAPDSDLGKFFKGEFYFYRGNYEHALKYYLEAKSIPHFSFFCYRASGYIALFRKDLDKALQFANKAKEIFEGDVMIEDLIAKAQENSSLTNLSLSDEELQELGDFFHEKEEEEPGLFSQESHSFETIAPLHAKEEQEIHLKELEEKIQAFQEKQTAAIKTYLNENTYEVHEDCFYFLQGTSTRTFPVNPLLDLIAPRGQSFTGGFFLSWNQKGIAINPGKGFLKAFHDAKLHLHNLDAIIVTRNDEEAFSDIEEIYALNAKLNENSKEPHVIHYYLNPKAALHLSSILKPHYKQERRSLHILELFIDSPDVEKIEIAKGISLNYFPLSGSRTFDQKESSTTSLGIRLDLSSPDTLQVLCRLGYISGAPWSPMIPHHLGNCDLLIAGMGSFQQKNQKRDPSLGYYGALSLLEETSPKLLILAEMSGKEGDIRLEVAKKIRHDYLLSSSKKDPCTIIPGDFGLIVDLKKQHIACAISKTFAPTEEIKVLQTESAFGPLKYISSECLL